ncbi:MAG TPA: hypothetical protein VF116_12620 [Ktedonobacterales bacterium]
MPTITSLRTSVEQLLRKGDDTPATGSQPRPDIAWRAVARRAAGIWLATRAALLAITYYAVTYLHGTANGPAGHDTPILSLSPDTYLNAWLQWDVHWYLRVGLNGYAGDPAGAAFFPLYPILIRGVSFVVGADHALFAAMLLSNLAALAAFIGLGLLVSHEAGFETATRSIRLLAAYPLAFFLAAGYGDSLFIALAVFALLFARRGQWWWAAGCALLAGFTRITALILIAPLLWEYGRQHDWWRNGAWRTWLRQPRAIAELLALAAAVPASIGIFAFYLWRLFGDPLMIPHIEGQIWTHRRTLPWNTLIMAVRDFFAAPFGSMGEAHMLFDLMPVLAFGAITLALLRRMPVAYTLYMIGLIGLSLASPIIVGNEPLLSVGRYMMAAIPMFLVLGTWTRRSWLDTLLVTAGFGVQAILLMQFFAHSWIV